MDGDGAAGALRVQVCVPARDERRRLPVLLAALARQVLPPGLRFGLCLHLDGCTDGTPEVAARGATDLPFPVVTSVAPSGAPANAGRARRAAMALGLARLGGAPGGGLLLSTDADGAPAPGWVAAACAALGKADVVAGRILRAGPRDARQDEVEAYYDRLHALRRRIDPVPWDPPPGHHFTGGANLGFRAEAYAALGGFSEHAAGEDALIVDEAARAGLRVRRDPAPVVRTSARRAGRAPGGLADALRALDIEGGAGVRVLHPADAAWQHRAQALARRAFAKGLPPEEVVRLASRFGVAGSRLVELAARCPNAEAFAMRAAPARPGARTVPLHEAQAALAALERAPPGCAEELAA